jgi:putative membrane protein
MRILTHWLVSAAAIGIAAYLLAGVTVTPVAAVVLAVILGAINRFIKPLLLLLTLPITILTLGIFALVVNAGLVLLASAIVPGFVVDGFWWALAFSVVLWLVNAAISSFDR